MNLSYFIAKRLAFTNSKSFTKVIIGIAIAGLALSIAVIIISSAIITGFKKEINNKIFGFWGNIHITDASNSRDFELKPIIIDSSYYQEIKEINFIEYQAPVTFLGREIEGKFTEKRSKGGVERVHPYIVMPCLIETKKDMLAGLFKGVNEEFQWSGMQRFMIDGTGINHKDSTNQVVISKLIADKLNLKVNSKLIVTFIKETVKLKRVFLIKGIYKTGLEEYDERFILGKAEELQDILSWGRNEYSGIEIFTKYQEDIDLLNEYIYAAVLPTNLYSETIQEKFPNIFEWLKLQDINEKIIMQLMAVVAIINLITVLLILILERIKMVGVLKSIGASNWSIRKVFIYHASFILLFGMIIGNILGIGICMIQKYTGVIKLDEENYYLDTAPVHLIWSNILLINFVALIICVLTLILPSILVSKISPIKALRFD